MKKKNIVLIIIASTLAVLLISVISLAPFGMILGIGLFDSITNASSEVEIDSFRLCQTEQGDNIIIVKYLLKNNSNTETQLYFEGDFIAYQNGVSLTEYEGDLPKECNYDPNDPYKYVKSGVEFYGEIAYILSDTGSDVEVEVVDYDIVPKDKQKVFKIK